MSLLKHDPDFDGTGYNAEITMLAKLLITEDWQRARASLANVITQEVEEKDAEIRRLLEDLVKLLKECASCLKSVTFVNRGDALRVAALLDKIGNVLNDE